MNKKDFGSRLREVGKGLNKTQQEMGRLLWLGKSGFGKYEGMENFPKFKILQTLATESAEVTGSSPLNSLTYFHSSGYQSL